MDKKLLEIIAIQEERQLAMKELSEQLGIDISFSDKELERFIEEEFAKYLKSDYAIMVNSGSSANLLMIASLFYSNDYDLKKGDEVITTNFSFASTIEVILLLGLKPVIVDIDPKTFNIDPSLIENKITERTKVIIPVHLFGQSCRIEEIIEIANKNNLQVIEDNAQAVGAKYTFTNGETKKTGTMGHIGTTCFFPSNNLGCYGDGGAIFTFDEDFAKTKIYFQFKLFVNFFINNC